MLVPALKEAGITVFHVVPTLRGALKAIAAGVDGLVIEGVEGGGFKNPNGASSMVLVPLIAAAGERATSSAPAASATASRWRRRSRSGAEGVQMGTRMLTGRRVAGPRQLEAGRAGRRGDRHRSSSIVTASRRCARCAPNCPPAPSVPRSPPPLSLDGIMNLYFGGEMNAAYAMSGQVAGRIDEVLPVREILETTWRDCQKRLREFGAAASAERVQT